MINVVSFPGLGLEFTLNRVAFTLFGRPIYWYGILIGFGFLLAVMLCCKRAPQYGLTEEHVLDALFYAVPLGLIGVRAYYVIFYLDLYRLADGSLDWAAIFRYSDGGLAIYGGLIGGILGIVLFARRRKISFLAFVDLCVLGLPLSQAIGRWGNYFNGEAYGFAVTQAALQFFPLSVFADGQWHLATFFYESCWNLIGFLLLWRFRKHAKKAGDVALCYLLWYGAGRLFIEGLRTDSLLLLGMRVSQLLSLGMCVTACVWLGLRHKKCGMTACGAALGAAAIACLLLRQTWVMLLPAAGFAGLCLAFEQK